MMKYVKLLLIAASCHGGCFNAKTQGAAPTDPSSNASDVDPTDSLGVSDLSDVSNPGDTLGDSDSGDSATGGDTSPTTDWRFGLFTRFSPAMCVSEMPQAASKLSQLGATFAMEVLSWGAIETNQSSYDWAQADAAIAAIPLDIPIAIEIVDPPNWINDQRGPWSPPMFLHSQSVVLSGTYPSQTPTTLTTPGALTFLELVTNNPPTVYHHVEDFSVARVGTQLYLQRASGSSIAAGATVYCKYAAGTSAAPSPYCNQAVTFSSTSMPIPGGTSSTDMGRLRASITCNSEPLYQASYCPQQDYGFRFGDPSQIVRMATSTIADGGTVYVTYYAIDDAAFAAFASAAAQRYGTRVEYWQPWDEPNLMWYVAEEPENYGRLTIAMRNAIQSVSPGAKILVGGTGGTGIATTYLTNTLQYVGPDNVDGIAFHTFQNDPESSPLIDSIEALSVSLTSLGFLQPFYVTSFGWVTHSSWGGSLEQQADFLVRSYAQILASPRVVSAFWFDMRDGYPYCSGAPQTSSPGVYYGLLNYDFSDKPSATAFTVLRNTLFGLPFSHRLNLGNPNYYGVVFANAQKRVSIVWTTGVSVTVDIPATAPSAFNLSVGGVQTDLSNINGFFNLTIGPSPVLVIETF